MSFANLEMSISDEEKLAFLKNWVDSNLNDASRSLFVDLLKEEVELDAAVGRAVFNNIVVEALQEWISSSKIVR